MTIYYMITLLYFSTFCHEIKVFRNIWNDSIFISSVTAVLQCALDKLAPFTNDPSKLIDSKMKTKRDAIFAHAKLICGAFEDVLTKRRHNVG